MKLNGWHWAWETQRDGLPLQRKGEKRVHTGPLVPCASGLHWSPTALDGLQDAPGIMVARVCGGGETIAHGDPVDKYASRERTALTDYVDAWEVLVALSRSWALRALRVHIAGALRKAGLHAEADTLAALPDDCDMASARFAVGDAAMAAGSAVGDAAWEATWDAWEALEAAEEAEEDGEVAEEADWVAGVARSAAGVAGAAAWEAERTLQNSELENALHKLFKAGKGKRKKKGGIVCGA